jgi:processive 1,2-diacylglycerol beta-glucosyltransferase
VGYLGLGRDNLLHELELGQAHACVPTPRGVTASVLALRDQAIGSAPPAGPAARWEPAYVAALRRIGVDLEYHDHELAGTRPL